MFQAECTHDGSARHIEKFSWQWGWEVGISSHESIFETVFQTFQRRVLDEDRLNNLNLLQSKLLTTGFRFLKPGWDSGLNSSPVVTL